MMSSFLHLVMDAGFAIAMTTMLLVVTVACGVSLTHTLRWARQELAGGHAATRSGSDGK